jgi:hypothetical protein
MISGTQEAHKALEALITKALSTGKPRAGRITISYAELMPTFGAPQTLANDLVVTIQVNWETVENEE